MKTLLAALALVAALATAAAPFDSAQGSPEPRRGAQTPQTPPAPQTPQAPPTAEPVQGPTFRTGIDLIAVDVAVVDRNGRPVEDLGAAEFSVKVDGESVAAVFRSVGGEIRQSWCGPCFGQGPDALQPGQRAITSFNRNWQNRMGVGGEGYLASPAIVAASALAGYMAPPGEIGLTWDPEIFGI